MATGFSTHVPRPTNPGDGPKRDTLICTFCRQKRIKCHGEHYDHLNGGKCDPCKTHHLPCSPREAAPGLSKDAGTRKRKRLPELPHQVTPQPSTSTASVRSHAPARPIQPRIVSQEDKCADVQCDLHQSVLRSAFPNLTLTNRQARQACLRVSVRCLEMPPGPSVRSWPPEECPGREGDPRPAQRQSRHQLQESPQLARRSRQRTGGGTGRVETKITS